MKTRKLMNWETCFKNVIADFVSIEHIIKKIILS